MSATHLLVRSWPASVILSDPRLRGHCSECGEAFEPDSCVSSVIHKRRFLDAPNATNARAYLCDSCVAKLGDKVEKAIDPDEWEPREIPGRDVEPW